MSKQPTFFSSLKENLEIAQMLRKLQIYFDAEKCVGVWQCYEVCPVGCWIPDKARRKAIFLYPEKCIACNACILQCPEKAIELR